MPALASAEYPTGLEDVERSEARARVKPLTDALWELLHRPAYGKEQYLDSKTGEWHPGLTKLRQKRDFLRHFAGEATFLWSCVKGGKCLFVAWDIDVRLRDTLAKLRSALERERVLCGAFVLEGSDADRAKVVLALLEPAPLDVAREFAQRIGKECHVDKSFPNNGGHRGNGVRLLGRNRMRGDGHLESRLLDFEGNVVDDPLSYLRGVSQLAPRLGASGNYPTILSLSQYSGEERPESANGIVGNSASVGPTGYDNSGELYYTEHGSDNLLDHARRIAYRIVDDGGQLDDFRAALRESVSISVEASARARERMQETGFAPYVWGYVQRHPRTRRHSHPRPDYGWKPMTLDTAVFYGYRKPTQRQFDLYVAACRIVGNKNPRAFEASLSLLGDYYGVSDKASVRDALDGAESKGLLFRLDRGASNVEGRLTQLLMLRGEGESLQQCFDRAVTSPEYLKRLEDRKTLGLDPPAKVIRDGRIVAA
jgi:hypothetical protein